jgi:hypothetical protein
MISVLFYCCKDTHFLARHTSKHQPSLFVALSRETVLTLWQANYALTQREDEGRQGDS